MKGRAGNAPAPKTRGSDMKNTLKIILASALLTGVGIKAAPAFAEAPEAQTYVSVVETADLDLASPDGQRSLEQRVARAAREVCGIASDVDVVGKNKVRQCLHDTIAKASDERDALLASAKSGAAITVAASH